jgi:high-affinity nickel-transport protein
LGFATPSTPTISPQSVIVAVIVGGLETLNLIGDRLGLIQGRGFWGAIGSLNDNFDVLGYVIVGIFVMVWPISYIVYRVNRYDEIEVSAG